MRTVAKRQLPSLLVVSFIVNLLLLVSAIYMLQVYDRVLSSGSMDTLIWLTLAALGALAVYGVLENIRRVILGRTSYWVETKLSGPVIRRSMSHRLGGSPPEASLRDVADIRAFIGGDAVLAFLDAPWTPIFVAFIWALHPGLGLLALCSAIALFLFALANDLLTRNPQRKLAGELRNSQADAQQFVESAETILPLGMGEAVLRRWLTRYRDIRGKQEKLNERTSGISSASRALRLALQVLILGLGAYYVLKGEVTSGAMIAASIVLGRALAPIERSIGAWRSFIAARSAQARLDDLFSGETTQQKAVKLPRPAGRLDVENVYCVAPVSGETILGDIAFSLEPGETLAIVGPSGSGKSTLCRLLVGAWKPTRGHVRLDRADVSTWDSEDLGPYLGYLPQEVELFPGTVAQNIARMQEIDDSEIIKAATAAGVHELILRLPQGYETDVGLHGARISGGQRQRLGLARALMGNPSLIVLDEPSSNLDASGDAALAHALARLKANGQTVVVVTHRAVGLRSADKILVLCEGAVVKFGPREQVFKVQSQTPAEPAARSTTVNFVKKA